MNFAAQWLSVINKDYFETRGLKRRFTSQKSVYLSCLFAPHFNNNIFRFNFELGEYSEDGSFFVFNHFLVPRYCIENLSKANYHECSRVFVSASSDILPSHQKDLYFIINRKSNTAYLQTTAPGKEIVIQTQSGRSSVSFNTPLQLQKSEFPIVIHYNDPGEAFSLMYSALDYAFTTDLRRSLHHYLVNTRQTKVDQPISNTFISLSHNLSDVQRVLSSFQELLHKSPIVYGLVVSAAVSLSCVVSLLVFCLVSLLCCPTRLKEWAENTWHFFLIMICCFDCFRPCRDKWRNRRSTNMDTNHQDNNVRLPLNRNNEESSL